MTERKVDCGFILTEEKYEPVQGALFEGVMTIGNGYVHARGVFEEGLSSQPQDKEYRCSATGVVLNKAPKQHSRYGTYAAGIFGNHPELNEVIANLPHVLDFTVIADGETLDMLESVLESYQRSLNMYEAIIARRVLWRTQSGCLLELSFERFASAAERHIMCQKLTITAIKGNPDLKVFAGIDAGVRTNGYNPFVQINTGLTVENTPAVELVTDHGETVCIAAHANSVWRAANVHWRDYAGQKFEFRLQQSAVIEFEKKVYITTSRDSETGVPEARLAALVSENYWQNYSRMREQHTAIWAKKWEQADIVLDGNEKYQFVIRQSLYYLLQTDSINTGSGKDSVPWFTGESVLGRFSWDAEIYLLPFYLYTMPEKARELIFYRFNTMTGAKCNAAGQKCVGACYAVASGTDGSEQCPSWQRGDSAVHVTAAIAFGMYHYYLACGDEKFALDIMLPVLLEASRYWFSRADRCAGRYELLGVTGPDEYTPFSANNYYTNYMVKFLLQLTVDRLMKLADSLDEFTGFAAKFNLDKKEIVGFAEMAKELPLLRGEEQQLWLQSEEFNRFPAADFENMWTDREKTFAANVTKGRCYRMKCLQRADLLMIPFLFPDAFSAEELRTCYNYYNLLTTHDQPLSLPVYAILAARLGNSDEAAAFFERYAATADFSGNKMNAAGCWLIIICGFLGLRFAAGSKELVLQPLLPEGTDRLMLSVNWRGVPVDIDCGRTFVKVANRGENEFVVRINNRSYAVKAGAARKIKYGDGGKI